MLGDLVAVCLRATTSAASTASPAAAETTPATAMGGDGSGGGSGGGDGSASATLRFVTRALLLLRNLALAPSTGQVRSCPPLSMRYVFPVRCRHFQLNRFVPSLATACHVPASFL